MPHFFRAIRRQPIRLISEGDILLKAVQLKLSTAHGEKANALIALIDKRRDAFYKHISTFIKENDRQPSIQAYIHFAKNLKEYIDFPNNVFDRISHYHNSNHYCNVGGENNEYSYSLNDQIARIVINVAIVTIIASLLIMPFNLPAGLIILGIALAAFAPSMYYALAITRTNAQEVQREETELFLAADQLVNPLKNEDLIEHEENQYDWQMLT